MGAQNQVGCLGNAAAPFFSNKWVGFRVPAISATECTALKVDNSAKAGSVHPAAAHKTMDQHIAASDSSKDDNVTAGDRLLFSTDATGYGHHRRMAVIRTVPSTAKGPTLSDGDTTFGVCLLIFACG